MIEKMGETLCKGCFSDIGNLEKCPYCGFSSSIYKGLIIGLSPGSILADRYQVGRVLGSGGFGITYLAYDMKLEIAVAVKEYLPRMFASRKEGDTTVLIHSEGEKEDYLHYLEGFLDEARLLAKFNHESGIVSVIDFFKQNETAYIVMFYVNGITLEEYLKQQGGRIPYGKAVEILSDVMASLSKVHAAGLIHRDISPDNICITLDNQVKLLDFGAARLFVGREKETVSVLLKHGYAPLEQYSSLNHDQGPWTDVYALGATLYRMIAGVVPESVFERLQGHELSRLTALGVDIPAHAERVIRKALSVKWNERYPDVLSFLDALHGTHEQEAFQDDDALDKGGKQEDAGHTELLRSVVENGKSMKGNIGKSRESARRTFSRLAITVAALAAILVISGFVWVYAPWNPTDENQPANGMTGFLRDYFRTGPGLKTDMKPDTFQPVTLPKAEQMKKVKLADPVLEMELRRMMGIKTGDIMVRDALKMTRLTLKEKGITNIGGLENFANLRVLDIQFNKINDLSPLSGLQGLEVLYAQNNRITSVEPVKNLKRLDTLNINYNQVQDLSPLRNMHSLRRIDLFVNPVSDITPLSGLVELHELSFYKNPFTDLEPLRNLTNLTHCCLIELDIKTIEPFRLMTKMESINLDATKIDDISIMANMPELNYVSLQATNVSDLTPLADKVKIRDLLLNGSAVTNYEPIRAIFPLIERVDFQLP